MGLKTIILTILLTIYKYTIYNNSLESYKIRSFILFKKQIENSFNCVLNL